MHSTGFVVCLPHCWHGLLLIEIAIMKNEHVKTQEAFLNNVFVSVELHHPVAPPPP